MKRFLAKGAGRNDPNLTPYQPNESESSDPQQAYPSPQQAHRRSTRDIANQTYFPEQVNRTSYQATARPLQLKHASIQSAYPSYGEEDPRDVPYSNTQYHDSNPIQHYRNLSHGRKEESSDPRCQPPIGEAVEQQRLGFVHSRDGSYESRGEGQTARDASHKKEGRLFRGLRRHQKAPSRQIPHLEESEIQVPYSDVPERSQPSAKEGESMYGHQSSRSRSPESRDVASLPRHSSMVYESYGPSSGEELRRSLSLGKVEAERQSDQHKLGNRMWAGITARGRAIEQLLIHEEGRGKVSRTEALQREERPHLSPHKVVIPLGPKKDTKWFDLKGFGGAAGKGNQQAEGEVTAKIGWLCSDRASPSDWSHILSFADTLAISEEASREAIQTLRREFKLGDPEAQKRAVKVWAVLFLNSSDLFRLQAVKKPFLEVLEQTVVDPKTSLRVKERLLDAWAMLAYHYQGVPQLSTLTKSYNKVRPSDRGLNGEPLNTENEIFFIPSTGSGNPHRPQNIQHQKQSQQQPLQRPSSHCAAQESESVPWQSESEQRAKLQNEDDRYSSDDSDDGDDPDTIQLLFQACDVARMDANLLIDALTSSGLHSPKVQELVRQCQHSLELLDNQMEWTNLQVNRAHSRSGEERIQTESHGEADLQAAPPEGKDVIQERLLASMEEARELLAGSLRIVEETEREEKEMEEERRVTELSKIDFRVDRSTLQQGPITGEAGFMSNGRGSLSMPGTNGSPASDSRNTSPQRPSRPLPSLASSTAEARLEEKLASPLPSGTVTSLRSSNQSGSSAVRIDRSPFPSLVQSHLPSLASQCLPTNIPVSPSTSIVDMPTRPSEKALGKRRAMSRGDLSMDVEKLTGDTERLAFEEGTSGPGFSETRETRESNVLDSNRLPAAPLLLTGYYASSAEVQAPSGPPISQAPQALPIPPSSGATSVEESNIPITVLGQRPPPPTPPSLPPLPAAYRAEQQQRDRRPPPLPTPGLAMQSKSPFATFPSTRGTGGAARARAGAEAEAEAEAEAGVPLGQFFSPPLPPSQSNQAVLSPQSQWRSANH